MRLALCQINPTVGDIAGNASLIRAGIAGAREGGADLVLFGELAVTGYPPEDLLLREHFLADAQSALSELAADTHGVVAIVGFPERAEHVYNAAAVLADGAIRAIYRKVHLPNYGVFDERRYFQPGISGATIELGEQLLGLTVCEDIWLPGPPASEEAADGARLILNISASPYHAGKGAERERMFAERAHEDGVPIAFCGLVGGQDELLFDGHSFVVDQHGKTIARAAQFSEDLLFCDLELDGPERATAGDARERPLADEANDLARDPLPPLAVLPGRSPAPRVADTTRLTEPLAPEEAEIYTALMLGLHDYVEKNGFSHVVLGLSGGIDSALVACLAADALGAERVSAAIMPSPYSSSATQNDARALAAALGVRTHELEIEPVMDAYTGALQAELAGQRVGGGSDLTEENLQARIRGNLLMALSNKFGWLVLTTGNKSEMSVGYTTLYGDLAGGFAVIKDVPKTLVYRLCEWRNSPAGGSVSGTIPPRAEAPNSTSTLISGKAPPPTSAPIPTSILTRAPSAELRYDQRDEDSLPPYELLDRILYGYIELNHGREQLVAQGLPAAEVDRMIRLVDLAEYKRRQAPPGIKVTTRAFGRDRRMPITNRYRG